MKAKNFWYMRKIYEQGVYVWEIRNGENDSIMATGGDDTYHFYQELCNDHNKTHLEYEEE